MAQILWAKIWAQLEESLKNRFRLDTLVMITWLKTSSKRWISTMTTITIDNNLMRWLSNLMDNRYNKDCCRELVVLAKAMPQLSPAKAKWWQYFNKPKMIFWPLMKVFNSTGKEYSSLSKVTLMGIKSLIWRSLVPLLWRNRILSQLILWVFVATIDRWEPNSKKKKEQKFNLLRIPSHILDHFPISWSEKVNLIKMSKSLITMARLPSSMISWFHLETKIRLSNTEADISRFGSIVDWLSSMLLWTMALIPRVTLRLDTISRIWVLDLEFSRKWMFWVMILYSTRLDYLHLVGLEELWDRQVKCLNSQPAASCWETTC